MIDLGSGIQGDGTYAADARLVVPADACLMCFGGLGDLGPITSLPRDIPKPLVTARMNPVDGRRGSLRSLNAAAVSMAIRLLEDLVHEKVADSRWLRFENDKNGEQSIQRITPEHSEPNCSWCGRTVE